MEQFYNQDVIHEWRIEPPPLAGEWLLLLLAGIVLALVLWMVAPAHTEVQYVSSATGQALCGGE